MDDDPDGAEMRILPREIFEPLPEPNPPAWAAPISLADASELDELIVYLCEKGNSPGGWRIDWNAYYEVVIRIWRMRIPITDSEFWNVMHAHGIAEEFEQDLKDFFTKGRDLLICAMGKKPIKKKMTQPFLSSFG
jgi:hypothetical protein